MFEYAISCGEGTLVDYGVVNTDEFVARFIDPRSAEFVGSDRIMAWAIASPDCETGE